MRDVPPHLLHQLSRCEAHGLNVVGPHVRTDPLWRGLQTLHCRLWGGKDGDRVKGEGEGGKGKGEKGRREGREEERRKRTKNGTPHTLLPVRKHN